MLKKKMFLLLLLGVFLAGTSFANQLPAVPTANVDFDVDVSVWWYNHPLNPEGPNYTPDIASPAHTVQLNPGDSIGTAINNLPSTGGTILLAPGQYQGNFNIIGKSNVHIIAPDGAQINPSPRIVIAAGPRSIDYGPYNVCFKQRDPQCLDEWDNRIKNIYFKNIVFDGGNSATRAVDIKTSDGVMFDQCVFQNIRDTGTGHGGLVNGHAGCDSVWFRDSHFVGSQRWALYLDGGYGTGLINCTIEGNFRSGILWLCNEDFSMDRDQKGYWTKEERRNMQYSIVYGNHFTGDLDTVVSATGNDLMILNNTVDGAVNHFTFFNPKSSLINRELVHYCYDIYVENNTMNDEVGIFAHFNWNLDELYQDWTNKSHLGRYTVRGNRINAPVGDPIRHTGLVDGPNIACGNCWNNASCVTDDTCTDVLPDTDPPTVPKDLVVTGNTGRTVGLQWEASVDNYGVEGYLVYRNGDTAPLADVTDTNFIDMCLDFGTQYTYQVSAYDAAGNISGKSQSVTVTTRYAGDLDGSRLVDIPDLAVFVDVWLDEGACLDADFNFDGKIDFQDYAFLVGQYWTGPDDTPPTDPTNLIVVEEADTSITLSWDASSDDTGRVFYDIYRDGVYVDTTEDTTYTDTGVAPATTYEYFIIAVDVAGNESNASSIVTATTISAVNMLVNPSFEDGTDSWAIWQQGDGHIAIVDAASIPGVDAIDGNMILMVDGSKVFQWGPEIRQDGNNMNSQARPNRTYRCSVWLKMDNLTLASGVNEGVRLDILELNEGGSVVGQSSTSWASGTADWHLIEVEHTTGNDVDRVQIRIDAGQVRGGYAYFDLAEFVVVE